jgi:hypothetical protein
VEPENQRVFLRRIVAGRDEKTIRHLPAFFVRVHFLAKWRLFFHYPGRGDPFLTNGVRAAGNENKKNNH